jgi:transposase
LIICHPIKPAQINSANAGPIYLSPDTQVGNFSEQVQGSSGKRRHGLDMSVFGTHQRLCSWAKTSPRTKQSGRKKGKATTGKGNPYLKAALGQMATGAAKTDTFLGARYRRLIKRMPKPKALAAVERSILVIIFHMLADPTVEFADLGADFYTRRIDRDRRTSQLTRQLQALGYTVTLTTAA